jgi:hypothetical protein
VQRDIEQPALAVDRNLRQARYGLRHEFAVLPDDPEPARTLRYEHPAIGQEGEAPRIFETLDHLHQANHVFLRLDRLPMAG